MRRATQAPYCLAVRIAHLSDLHLLSLEGAVPYRLMNKRITGYLNLRFHRTSIHKPCAVRAAARAIKELGVDHVVITGDVSNLALENEFELVRAFLADDLGLPADRVSLVPGNHDVYTGGAHRSRRFARTFAAYLGSDLADLTPPGEVFPFVHLRGPVAIIGLSTALPRPPLVASGEIGRAQLDALAKHPRPPGAPGPHARDPPAPPHPQLPLRGEADARGPRRRRARRRPCSARCGAA